MSDAWKKGNEAVQIVDDLRKAGRVIDVYFKHLVWHSPSRVVTWDVRPDESVRDAEWRAIREHAALDIEHPATKGILLAYVREVAGDPRWHVRPPDPGHRYWFVEASAGPGMHYAGDTEGEALLTTLRALRDSFLGEV